MIHEIHAQRKEKPALQRLQRRFCSFRTRLEAVHFSVGLDEIELALFGTTTAIAMFHPVDASETLGFDVLEHIFVIDFAGERLCPPWIVANLEVSNLRPREVDIWNDISLGDLLMIDIKENLAAWRIDSPADFKGLWRLREELPRVITPRV